MFSALLVLSLAAAGADEKSELKALAGVWIIEKAEIDGTDQTALFKDATLTIKEDGAYDVEFMGKHDKGITKVNPAKSPREIDITGQEGPNKDKTFPAIYEVKDNTLKVCYGLDYKTRPAKFETAKDSQRLLITYKRKK